MLIEIILITISVFLMIFLVSVRYLKIFYARNDNNSFLIKTDKKIIVIWDWLRNFCINTINDFSELIKDIPHITLHFLNRIFYKLYKKTKKLIYGVKTKNIKTDGGAVSVYLKKIDSDK